MRRLAFQVTEANSLPHRFNREKGMVGWGVMVQGFISCHPELHCAILNLHLWHRISAGNVWENGLVTLLTTES
jgi:hypothetical protein